MIGSVSAGRYRRRKSVSKPWSLSGLADAAIEQLRDGHHDLSAGASAVTSPGSNRASSTASNVCGRLQDDLAERARLDRIPI